MEPSAVQQAKLAIVAATGLSKDALHICVGLAVFLVMAYFWRKRPGSAVPLLVVVAVAALGEAMDARDDIRSLGRWRWRASAHDIWITLFAPIVLWLLVRFRKRVN